MTRQELVNSVSVYDQLAPLTAVIKSYREDFTVHDLRSFREAKNGDIAIWTAGRCGTHLAFTHRAGKPCSTEHADAVKAVYGRNPVWRLIDFTGPNTGYARSLTH